jgi:hypothetical protein|uniref:Uncharacterized protein n=1 Tax=candidate division WOR-3 bacterium TaxID=2052148 RepID=A0A7V3RGY5_UNCW3
MEYSFSAQKPGATFLLISPTAKATGMAYVWTSIVRDASANYYNGAGLAFLKSVNITFTYFKYLPGLQDDMPYIYVAGAYPLVNSSWGFDVICYSPGKKYFFDRNGNYLGEKRVYDISPQIN